MPLAVPPAVAPHFGDSARPSAPAHVVDPPTGGPISIAAAGDEIDLDQLASLLDARLGSLSLPTRHD
jgi:hypothetical protein